MRRSNAATNPLCRHRMWRERSTIAAFGLVAASWSARWSAGPPQWVTTAEKTEPDWSPMARLGAVGRAETWDHQVIIAGAVAS